MGFARCARKIGACWVRELGVVGVVLVEERGGGRRATRKRGNFGVPKRRRDDGDGLCFWNFDYLAAGGRKPGPDHLTTAQQSHGPRKRRIKTPGPAGWARSTAPEGRGGRGRGREGCGWMWMWPDGETRTNERNMSGWAERVPHTRERACMAWPWDIGHGWTWLRWTWLDMDMDVETPDGHWG